MTLRIGIAGTRGIPNRYGGFEQMAEYLSAGLVRRGHEVIVYSPHHHPYKQESFNGAKIVRCFDPAIKIGTAGQFIYDFNCIMDARRRNFDIFLMLGYTSSSVWGSLFDNKSIVIFNMDGMEWKRDRYNSITKKFLLFAEKLAVKYSNYCIADSSVIQSYLQKKYKIHSHHIAYGATILDKEDEQLLVPFGINKDNYYLLIARMEPENNIEMILDGFCASGSTKKFLVIGNMANHHGQHLLKKFSNDKRIQFAGPVYHYETLHSLRHYCSCYFHGHSVGGTNPSLLEAMASRTLIASHNNIFNKAILQENAYYFSSPQQVKEICEDSFEKNTAVSMIAANFKKIKEEFEWERITDQYEHYFFQCIKELKNEGAVLQQRESFQ